MKFTYLSAAIGEVVTGLEDHEKIYALEQGQYIPLRTLPGVAKEVPAGLKALPGEGGKSAITRWELTDEQRQLIAEGADILLEVIHFGGLLAPVRMMLLDQKEEEDVKREDFNRWFAAVINAPFREKL